jgi:serine/threonine protein kinase/tetratricopeptide (TPR) repeat protein
MMGQTISHYRITDKLGAGGMGVVYKAVDLKLERTVALKFLPQELAFSDHDKEHMLREARSASALDHPNIGVIHGLEESEEHQLFIVMGYYEGETLTQKLRHGVLPVRESLDLAIQVAKGLSAAHARNIVHRDIKPSNIIITKDNTAKIVDFGLARVVVTATATQSGSATGTLPYMAPEQILGETVERPCDVWALGVILVQMLTGSHPFVRPNTAAMTFAILNQPPAALDAIPPAIQPVLYRALAKKSEQRYPDASAMLKDLECARVDFTSDSATLEEPTLTRSVSAQELRKYVDSAAAPRWTTEQQKKPRSTVLALVGLVLAFLVALSFPRVRENLFGSAYAGGDKHIAVLPFDSSAADPEYQLVADGLMDSITNELSNLDAAQQSLWVVPASVVRSRKVSDPTAAFRELGATMVIQGRIEQKGQAVFLTVNLIDSKHLRQIGSAKVDALSGDLTTLQNDAVSHLAGLMKVKVPAPARTPPGSVASSAYESYLKALGYMQRYDKPGNLDLAVSALKFSVEKDPRFALGYATLGEAYRLKFQTDHHPGWVGQAFANCQTAVEIDDRLPAVHVTVGLLNATLGKNDLALREFQRALEINPRDADALIGMAGVYEHTGRIADAEATYKRAIALRPDYWDGYNSLGDFYDRQKRVQDSIAQYRRIIELTPDNTAAYNNLGIEYMELNDPASSAAAEAAFQKSIQLAPTYQAYTDLGWLYLGQKRYAEAAASTEKALELNDKDWRVWANLLAAYQWLKDDEKMRPVRAKTLNLLEEYAALNSQEASVQSTLGSFYAEDKLREKALAHANAALALAPTDAWVLADLAETYEHLGDRKRAMQYAHDSLKNGYTLTDLQRRPGLLGLLADPGFRNSGKQ